MLSFFMAGKHTIKVNGTLTTNNYQNDQKLDPRAPAQTFYKDSTGAIVQHGKEPIATTHGAKGTDKIR